MSAATVPRGTAFLYPGSMEESLKEVILTAEGHKKLKQEIEHLSTVKRREVAERIKQAREFGDIAENAEYDDAKNEQAMLEHRIATLQERLKSARVIQKKEIPAGVVAVGTKVRLRDIDAKETIEYHIVGSAEANPAEHKLSNESPVGKALLGNKRGDKVSVTLPSGKARELKITKIDVAKV
jgi:transcription elongation factor GreA